MTHSVAFFSNQFAMQSGHGIARYARELYWGIQHMDPDIKIVPVSTWSDRSGEELDLFKYQTGLEVLKGGSKMLPLAWKYLDYPKIESLLPISVDLVHALSPGYPIATSKPYVVTVHDVGPLTHPQFFTKKDQWLMGSSIKQAAKKADALLCVSRTTSEELISYVSDRYGFDISDRCHVVYEGVHDSFTTASDTNSISDHHLVEDLLDKPFILTVGKISPRKNLQLVLDALKLLKTSFPDLQLLTVGGDGWDFKLVKEKVDELGILDRVHFLGYVSDDLLRLLYKRAEVFVYPSLFEGFGLTILEAMSAGCPVITSDRSCLPEIAGNAALFVDPTDSDQLVSGVSTLLNDRDLRSDLVERGRIRASEFRWQTTAEQTVAHYKSILEH
jgi:glycosyltransferase involved in cell wall biosynthesis